MESPITAVKANLKLGVIIRMFIGVVIFFAIIDFLNSAGIIGSGWFLTPYSSLKAKYFPAKSNGN